jgi:hypothetical protein
MRLKRYKPARGERRAHLVFVGPGESRLTSGGNRVSTVVIQCDCGVIKTIDASGISERWPKSCGCKRYEDSTKTMSRPLRGSPTYMSWASMRSRCSNPKQESSKYYLARGITVCQRWTSFDNFLADMGERPIGSTLDRIDPNGNYEPSNCRWAPPSVQQNNRRNNRWITIGNETKTLSQWCKNIDIDPDLAWNRLRLNWTSEQALGITPPPSKSLVALRAAYSLVQGKRKAA